MEVLLPDIVQKVVGMEYSLKEVLPGGNDRLSKHFHVGHDIPFFRWEGRGCVHVIWIARPCKFGPCGLVYTLSSRCRFLVNGGDVWGST